MNRIELSLFLLACIWPGLVIAQQPEFVSHAHGKLYYHTYGQGEAVILLSGGPGSSYLQVEPVASALSVHYRVIVPEQRGTGRSIPVPHDSTTINRAAAQQDISLLLSELGLKSAILAGHSWGARLALSYACRYPERVKALVLISPGLFNTTAPVRAVFNDIIEGRMRPDEVTRFLQYRQKIQGGGMSKTDSLEFGRLQTQPFVYETSRVDSLYAAIRAGGSNAKTQQLILGDLRKINFDLTADLPRLKVPVAVICGRQDPLAFVPYEIKLLLPATRLFWIERCGHFPMFEQPKALAETLRAAMTKSSRTQ